MDTSALKRFSQAARNLLMEQVSAKLALVLDPASGARRENPAVIKALEGAIAQNGKGQVIEQVAYTWFNRFTALRFMDVNGYTNPRIVSPEGNATRPEILAEAMAGNLPEGAPATITALLDGRTPSRDPQAEAYRLLLVHTCNAWHGPMPFMFEKLGDYSELLMPEDLLSPTSILARLRDAMPEDDCKDVEIIGWLYQFYISEKKDQVFAGLKKNVKITAENIPAATQLFTPHWIVRYLVENSLGRLWLLNRPGSKLAERMDYYIAPEQPETDFLRISKPEEIKLCDPACGSGHMLTYAFDLLYAIYEEEGYEAEKIPALILRHNLTGMEIDDRAGALAAFALAMKAAARLGRRRFLRMEVTPDIVVLQNVTFTHSEMQDLAAVVVRDLFTDDLRETLFQFADAKNFGSLIVPKLRDPAETLRVVEGRDFGGDLLLKEVQNRVVAVLRMADVLSSKYHVVVANPPYLSDKYYSETIKKFTSVHFKQSRFNFYSLFMTRNSVLARPHGFVCMVTLHSWMSGSKYEVMRGNLIENCSTVTMAHLGAGGFDSIDGQVVSATAFVFEAQRSPKMLGNYINLTHVDGESAMARLVKDASINFDRDYCYRVASAVFSEIPGSPYVYKISESELSAFQSLRRLEEFADFRQGMATTDNEKFLRQWFEMPLNRIAFNADSSYDGEAGGRSWFPYNKGGGDKRWYGHNDFVVNYEDHGEVLIDLVASKYPKISDPEFVIKNRSYYFRPSVTYSALSGGAFAARLCEKGFIFDTKGSCAFAQNGATRPGVAALLNSCVARQFIQILAPTLDFSLFALSGVPYPDNVPIEADATVNKALQLAKLDWDAYETSWDFTTPPILSPAHWAGTLEATYVRLRTNWQGMTDEMRRLEDENNRIFIEAYGLQDELTSEVPIKEITLTCNPAYRYGVKGTEQVREARLLADTIAEFVSYAVGCMFGRYSLDAPGLILANQGETLADYLARVPSPSFMPDKDNVLPVLDADWFADDIVARFRNFLRVTFGEQHLRENLAFIEAQIGDIRKYFTKGFYEDHVKRYRKRPIYWMFSSPKGTFQALIYMHCYRSDTVSILLNDYLREFIRKLGGERTRLERLADDTSASQGQRTRALKDVSMVTKQIAELEEWEREVIFPLAQAKIEIDLDDGVKRNYPKLGAALKTIKRLEEADE